MQMVMIKKMSIPQLNLSPRILLLHQIKRKMERMTKVSTLTLQLSRNTLTLMMKIPARNNRKLRLLVQHLL